MQAKDAPQFQKRLAVFDVGGMWHSIYRRQCADLVISEQVRNVVVMATMETFFRTRRSFAEKKRLLLLRLQNGSAVLHSGIDILRFSICIGRDEPFGAKPRPAIAG